MPPPLAVTVSVYMPVGAFFWVLIVSVEEPVPPDARLTGLGLKDAEVLAGRPDTLKVTLPLNPLVEVSVTVYVVLADRLTDRLAGLAPSKKSGAFGLGVAVAVGVFVGVLVGTLVGVFVAVLVGVLVAVFTGVLVGGRVGVAVGVLVGSPGVLVAVGVAVGAVPPQEGNLNEPMRVCQGAPPVVGMYSLVNQKVQSSTGSTAIIA